MMFRSALRWLLASQGYELKKISSVYALDRLAEPASHHRLRALLNHYNVNHVLDVGAFEGQFGTLLVKYFNYPGKITSFEPVVQYYQKLQGAAKPYCSRWSCMNLALGNSCTETSINIAGNSYSSSLLPMLQAHEHVAPSSAYIDTQVVNMVTLDSIFETIVQPSEQVYLKIDVQGFERQVLAGASTSLRKISTIQLEISLVELYEGEMLLADMIAYMQGLGYKSVMLIPGFANEESGELLQADVVFHRPG